MNQPAEASGAQYSEQELLEADATIAVLALEQAITAVKQGDRTTAANLIDLAKRATVRPPKPF